MASGTSYPGLELELVLMGSLRIQILAAPSPARHGLPWEQPLKGFNHPVYPLYLPVHAPAARRTSPTRAIGEASRMPRPAVTTVSRAHLGLAVPPQLVAEACLQTQQTGASYSSSRLSASFSSSRSCVGCPGPGSPRTGPRPWGGDPSHLGTWDRTAMITRVSAPLLSQRQQISLNQIFGRHNNTELHLGVEVEEPWLRQLQNIRRLLPHRQSRMPPRFAILRAKISSLRLQLIENLHHFGTRRPIPNTSIKWLNWKLNRHHHPHIRSPGASKLPEVRDELSRSL